MAQHIAYDTDKRIIYVTTAPVDNVVSIDVKEHLYSDMKVDWHGTPSLNKFHFPIRSVGGDALPGEKDLGATFFLDSLWKIRPYEADHIFRLNGNLYSEDGTSVMIPTIGNYNVLSEMTVSNLSDSTVAQLEEIEYASFNGGVSVDIVNGIPGTEYPIGTPQQAVNNMADAHLIAVDRGFNRFYLLSDLHITSATPALTDHTFEGQGKDRTLIEIDAIASVEDCEYIDAHVTGTLDGDSILFGCFISDLIYIKGFIERCVISAGTIVLGGGETAHFLDCWSGVPGSGTPIIDLGGSGQALAIRGYKGGIKLTNKTGTESVSIDLSSGQAILDNTVANGEIVCRGTGKLIDTNGDDIPSGSWNGCTIINETSVMLAATLESILNDVLILTGNKVTKSGDIITIYESDGITTWRQYDLANGGRVVV